MILFSEIENTINMAKQYYMFDHVSVSTVNNTRHWLIKNDDNLLDELHRFRIESNFPARLRFELVVKGVVTAGFILSKNGVRFTNLNKQELSVTFSDMMNDSILG